MEGYWGGGGTTEDQVWSNAKLPQRSPCGTSSLDLGMASESHPAHSGPECPLGNSGTSMPSVEWVLRWSI